MVQMKTGMPINNRRASVLTSRKDGNFKDGSFKDGSFKEGSFKEGSFIATAVSS
jgi:hypothetical protein